MLTVSVVTCLTSPKRSEGLITSRILAVSLAIDMRKEQMQCWVLLYQLPDATSVGAISG